MGTDRVEDAFRTRPVPERRLMAPGKDCQAIWWAAVSAMFIVPALGNEEGFFLKDLGFAFIQAAFFTTLVLVVGLKLIPRILRGGLL